MVNGPIKRWIQRTVFLRVGLVLMTLAGGNPAVRADPVRLSQWPEELRGAEAQGVVVVGSLAYIAGGTGGLFVLEISPEGQPRLVGHRDTPGFAKGVAVEGGRAYVADSENGLVILDVSDPSNPVVVGSVDTDGQAESVSVANGFAYVADADSGVVVNVANPTTPQRVVSLGATGRAGGIQVVGTRLYVAEGTSGLRIFDVSNPLAPVHLAVADTGGFAAAVQVVGSFAYVADGNQGLQILDVSSGAAPVPVGGIALPGLAFGIHVQGSLAAVTLVEGGVQLVDVSNPASPVPLSSIPTLGAAMGVQLGGSVAHVADAHSGLLVFHAGTPAAPVRLGVASISGEAQSVRVAGEVAYVADWNGGLSLVNVANPENPVWLGQFGDGTSVADVQVAAPFAYLADYREGLVVLDVSNPGAPVRVGGYAAVSQLIGLQVIGNRAYLAHGSGLEILDVSTPATPVRLGGVSIDGDVFRVRVVGTTAYLGVRNSPPQAGFQIIDVANPASPVFLGSFDPGGAVSGISLAGSQAFIAASEAGLQVLNVGNPGAVSQVGGRVTTGAAHGVEVKEGKAFVAEDDAGFSVFDVRNPANPIRTSLSGTRGHARGIHLAGDFAYVADSDGGLVIFTQATPINTPPQLTAVADQTVDELALWILNLTAQDSDVPANRLVFSLQRGPAGMVLSSDGQLTWRPSEAQGPSTNAIEVQVTDNGVPPLSASRQFQVVVREINSGPQIAPVSPQNLPEQAPWTLQLSVTDGDLPSNALTFEVLSGPEGLSVNAAGLMSWSPTEAQGPSAGTVLVRVTDNGVPPLSSTHQFDFAVSEVNLPPTLAAITQQDVREQAPLEFSLRAADADLPSNALTYALLSGPVGLTVSPAGQLSWVPTEAQGPSVSVVEVTVTDNGVPALSVTNQFTVRVLEENTPPTLAAVPPQEVIEGTPLQFNLRGIDRDEPANELTFALVSGPAGLDVGGAGRVVWTPSELQGPSTNTVVVRVTDNGVPPLAGTNQFIVFVRETNQAPVLSIIESQTLSEQVAWSLQLTAQDGDSPSNALTYSLMSGPEGLTVSASGLATWTPTEVQGPTVNTVEVKVTDDGVPPLSATRQFTITVDEVNKIPTLAGIAAQTVDALVPLGLSLEGSDPDLPANSLSYALVSGPAGLVVTAAGEVTWTPGPGQAPSTNRVLVQVVDSGTPALSKTNEFVVVALEVEDRAIVQVGIDDDPQVLPYIPYREFQAENNRNDLAPGRVTRLPGDAEFDAGANPSADDDFYVRGNYPDRFNSLRSRLLVPNDEPSTAWEHSLADGDRTNRLHFRLSANQMAPGTWIRFLTEFTSGGTSAGPGFSEHDVVVRFRSGAGVETVLYSGRIAAPTLLKMEFPVTGVQATAGANTVEIVRTGPHVVGTEFWVTFDYLRIEVDAGGNEPPQWASLPEQRVREGEPLTLSLTATDRDVPPTPLTYALVSGPVGLTVSPAGVVNWTPTESQGPSTNPVVVQVTDNGVPAKSTTNSLVVIVEEVNRVPVLPSLDPISLVEQVPWSGQLAATDADLPANGLTYALVSGPAGLLVNAAGLMTWTPRETQGPSQNTVTVKVTDNGVPPLSSTNQFTIAVTESNLPPALPSLPVQTVDSLVPLRLTLSGTDPDLPVNTLAYELVSGPEGLMVSAAGEVFWTPGPGQAPSTNRVVVQVTDGGEPRLSTLNEFVVVALEVEERSVMQIGVNDDPQVLPYFPFREFQPQNNLNDLPPGRVTRLPGDAEFDPTRNPGRDDDFYVRGIYPPGFNRLAGRLLVPNDEPPTAWEHSLTPGDRTNRMHFRLSQNQAAPETWIRLVTEFADGGSLVGGVLVPGFSEHDIVVRFRNGDGVESVLYSGRISQPSQLQMEFPLADVQATPGANSIEFVRTGPLATGTSYWVTFDFVWMQVDAGGNEPPDVTPVPDQTVREDELLAFTVTATDRDVPPTPLTFALVSGPAGLTVSNQGLVRWVPTEEQGPSTNIVLVKVTDNGVPQKSTTNSLVVVVQEVNLNPVLTAVEPQAALEQQPWSVQLSATDPDLPFNGLIYTLVEGPEGLSVSGSGLVTWTPAESQGPSQNTVTVRVTDGGEPPLSATQQFSLSVGEVNRAPELAEIPLVEVNELIAMEFRLPGSDPDLPENLLTYSLVSGPVGLVVSPAGLVTWTPTEGQAPSSNTVIVTVRDNGAPPLDITRQFSVRVREVNSVPRLNPVANQSIPEMERLELSLRAVDDDFPVNTLSYALVSGPDGMTVDESGRLIWIPTEVQGPSENSVVVQVTDNGEPALSGTSQFTLTVLEVNRAPVLDAVALQTLAEMEDWSLRLTVLDPDLPANLQTFALLDGPSGMTVSSDGVVRWKPDETQGPSDQRVTVTVVDNGTPALRATNQFVVRVTEVNRPPDFAAIPGQVVDELSLLEYPLVAGDEDRPANALAFSLVSGPAGLTVTPAGAVRWTPGEEQGPSTNTVVVRVLDDGEPPLGRTNEFTVVVREVNVPPVLPVPEVAPIPEEALWTTDLRALDADRPSNRLTYSLVSGPSGLTVSSEGAVSWTPGEIQGPSTQRVTVAVTDNGTPPLSVTNQFSVEVTEVNRPPSVTPVPRQSVDELALLEYVLSATDPDLPINSLTFGLVSGPAGLTVSRVGAVRWTPSEEQGPSTNTVVVRVTDGGVPSLSATHEFVVVVREVNSEPTFVRETLPPAAELAAWSEANLAEDGDLPPNRLTYSILSGPDGLTVSPEGTLRWVPSEAQGPSTNTLLVRVTDDGTPPLSTTQRYLIVVREVNSAPVLRPVPQQVAEEFAEWELQLSATDPDLPGNRLQFALVSGPPGLSVSGTGAVSWSPSEAQGPSTNVVLVRVFDNGLPSLSSTNQWIVVVQEVNTPPVLLSPGSQVAEERQPWKVQLQALDSDLPATPLNFSLVSGPPGLTVNAAGLVSWTPTVSQNPSTNLVVVRVSDSGPGALRATNRFVVAVTDQVLPPHLGIHLVVDQIIVDFETRSGWVYHLFSLPYTQAGKPNPAWDLLTPAAGLIGTGALEEFILPSDLPESGVLIRLTATPPGRVATAGP